MPSPLVSDLILRELSLIATYQGTKQELVEALQLAAQCGFRPVIKVISGVISVRPTCVVLTIWFLERPY